MSKSKREKRSTMNSRIRLSNMSMSIQSCHALKLPLILASAKAHCPDGSRKPENLMTARSTRLEAGIINQM